jgi:transposase
VFFQGPTEAVGALQMYAIILRCSAAWAGSATSRSAIAGAPSRGSRPRDARCRHRWNDQLRRAANSTSAAGSRSGVTVLVEAREIILEFQGIIRRKALTDLDAWISRAQASLVAAFANGVSKDKAAIEAAIALPWSNGQTEGQICKLKLVKRQMYGRGNLDLLQARIMGLG